jgi:hypothetical protein
MTKAVLKVMLVLFCALFTTAALADHEAGEPGDASQAVHPVAESNFNPRISGCVVKDNKGEAVSYDLQIGDARNHYDVKGNTAPDQGFYRTDVEMGGVQVMKRSIEDGLTQIEEIPNSGTTKIYPRKRKVDGEVLAGMSVGGYTVQKFFTNSLTMDNLSVDGKPSAGKMFYNVLNGHYTCPAGSCHFGDYAIQSTDPGGKTLLNYDNFWLNKNRMRVSMQFGDLQLKGLVKFNDTTQTQTDRHGDTHTEVVSTRGCFNVDLTKADGSRPVFSPAEKPGTHDDTTVRHLIAWLQLMTYDLFSE